MSELMPFSNYRITARLELGNKPGIFASVAAAIAKEKANLGAVDLVEVTQVNVIRDITFDAAGEEHAKKVIDRVRKVKGVKVVSVSDQILLLHLGGKISVQNKFPLNTRNRLSMAYTPGVAKVVKAIAEKPSNVYALTIKSNSVAIITDGSAILGLGNLGAEAALPVMEGKAMIFKEFAGIDAWPICLSTQDEEKIIETISHIAPSFGAINLEDISSPRCFSIEERLKKILDIPIMHDDQHGTAIVLLAALKNALKFVKKDLSKIRIVVNGLGAAGIACFRILLAAGARDIIGCDKKGAVLTGNAAELKDRRRNLFAHIHWDKPVMTLRQALVGADVFIGVSAGNVLKPQDLKKMRRNNIVFAMANPDPEVDPHKAIRYCRIFATGRSDFPNQINNALAFPGVFRGALNVRSKAITEGMKLAASSALASLVRDDQLSSEYIIPSLFDKRVVDVVAAAVGAAAIKEGIARRRTRSKSILEGMKGGSLGENASGPSSTS